MAQKLEMARRDVLHAAHQEAHEIVQKNKDLLLEEMKMSYLKEETLDGETRQPFITVSMEFKGSLRQYRLMSSQTRASSIQTG